MTRSSKRLAALAVIAALSAHTALACANPTDAQVVNGNVVITSPGNTLIVTNTPNAIINWQVFSISAGEITNFVLQSVASPASTLVVSPQRGARGLTSLWASLQGFSVPAQSVTAFSPATIAPSRPAPVAMQSVSVNLSKREPVF